MKHNKWKQATMKSQNEYRLTHSKYYVTAPICKELFALYAVALMIVCLIARAVGIQ